MLYCSRSEAYAGVPIAEKYLDTSAAIVSIFAYLNHSGALSAICAAAFFFASFVLVLVSSMSKSFWRISRSRHRTLQRRTGNSNEESPPLVRCNTLFIFRIKVASGCTVSLANAMSDARKTNRLKPLGRVRMSILTNAFCVTACGVVDISDYLFRLNIGLDYI